MREHPAEQRGLNTAIARRSARPLSGGLLWRSADEQVRACARARLRGGRARAHVGERKGASEGALNAVFNSCGQIWSSVRYYIYDT